METCSYCGKKDITVHRNLFDGTCANCTNIAISSEYVARVAKENNERLRRSESHE